MYNNNNNNKNSILILLNFCVLFDHKFIIAICVLSRPVWGMWNFHEFDKYFLWIFVKLDIFSNTALKLHMFPMIFDTGSLWAGHACKALKTACGWHSVNLFVCVVAAELRNALPELVVEILQEKLERKTVEDASRLPSMSTQPSVALTNSVSASHGTENTTSARCDDGLNEFPKNWEPMDSSEVSWLIMMMIYYIAWTVL